LGGAVKKVLMLLLVLGVLAGAGGAAFLYLRDQRVQHFSQEAFGSAEVKVVEIPSGSGPKALANLLAERGVVKSAEDFYLYIRREKAGPKLKAGEYEFRGPQTPVEVLTRIISGNVRVYRFTVPEGLRAEEIYPIVLSSDLKLDGKKLLALAESPEFLKKMKVPGKSIEGFLFPDTYTFTRSADEEAVLTKMISRTHEEYTRADAKRQAGIKLTLLQTITLASIVEKETGAPEERPRISCVFHNRLRKGMMLQTDPTVLYAMKLLRGTFVKNITSKDLRTEHPYNTYTMKGLPPGPIASPGSAAIHAALNPLDCDDLYFVSRNDGTHIFCPTLKCHNAAVDEWQKLFHQRKRKKARG
jgi:UPF0755 protein